MIKDILALQRIMMKKTLHDQECSLMRATARDRSDENFNNEGLIWWELQWQYLKFHNKRIWNLHWRREWC